MVKMTISLIRSSMRKQYNRKEGIEETLKRITHLNLQEKNIEKIENLDACTKLRALYLYDNRITKIENLRNLTYITTLYLHANLIEKIEGLETLVNLTSLRLSKNKIAVVEGLDNLANLEQLWLEYQQLPEGVSLTFDPKSLAGIGGSLKLINVNGNRIQKLEDLRMFYILEKLYIENNDINDLQEVVDSLVYWPSLMELSLRGNPVTRQRKYRDNVIVHSSLLQELDEKVVPEAFRSSLLRWKDFTTSLQSTSLENTLNPPMFLEAETLRKQAGILSLPNPLKEEEENISVEESDTEKEEESEEDEGSEEEESDEDTEMLYGAPKSYYRTEEGSSEED